MKSMNDIILMTKIFLFFVLYTINSGCADVGILTENYTGQSRIVFYGIVLDQHGKPVEGADVLYEVESFGLPVPRFSKGSVKSRGDGRFTIRGGERFSVVHQRHKGGTWRILSCRPDHRIRIQKILYRLLQAGQGQSRGVQRPKKGGGGNSSTTPSVHQAGTSCKWTRELARMGSKWRGCCSTAFQGKQTILS